MADFGSAGAGPRGLRSRMVAPGTAGRSLDAAASFSAGGILCGARHDAERPGTVRRYSRGEWHLPTRLSERRHSTRKADQPPMAVSDIGGDVRGVASTPRYALRGTFSRQPLASSAGSRAADVDLPSEKTGIRPRVFFASRRTNVCDGLGLR